MILAGLLFCATPTPAQDSNREARAALRRCRDVLNDPRTTLCERMAAVRDLGEVRTPMVAVGLGDILVRGDVPLRPKAAEILGTYRGVKGSTAALLRAFSHPANRKQTDVRVAVLMALGRLRDRAALPVVHDAIRGRDPLVARAGVRTVLAYRCEESVKVLIDTLRSVDNDAWDVTLVSIPFHGCLLGIVEDETEWRRRRILLGPLRKALLEATGLRFAGSREWMRWWKREGRRFRFTPVS